ncbi:MAG: hypothetical protein ACD_58C00020G0002 [uncultured bacterium]|nr:MAG: hypothetical protein ACD_58C00020G0002 [uncultured bacterium]
MPSHDEGGEHTLNPQELGKMKLEMKIRNSGSFIDLLQNLKQVGSIKGSEHEYTLGDNLQAFIKAIEENAKNSKAVKFNSFTREMGLRDSIKRLIESYNNNPDAKRTNADWFILETANDQLPMEDWPNSNQEWMENVSKHESAVMESTTWPVESITRKRGINNPKMFYLISILNDIDNDKNR